MERWCNATCQDRFRGFQSFEPRRGFRRARRTFGVAFAARADAELFGREWGKPPVTPGGPYRVEVPESFAVGLGARADIEEWLEANMRCAFEFGSELRFVEDGRRGRHRCSFFDFESDEEAALFRLTWL